VKGVGLSDLPLPFIEAKRLEVGRNANFHELSFLEWGTDSKVPDPHMLIIPLYDFFMLKKEEILLNHTVTETILQYVEENKQLLQCLFLLPIQYLHHEKENGQVTAFVRQINELAVNAQLIYLPSLYGPWQPEVFFYQKIITSSINNGCDIAISEREWIDDTVYIEDAVAAIMDIINSGKSGGYLIESGKKDYWQECAAYLTSTNKVDVTITPGSQLVPFIENDIIRVSVKHVTPVSESLLLQQKHFERLFSDEE